MLYDPKWDAIYTTRNFADWLAQQPPAKRYRYTDAENCAVAQYLKAHGVAEFELLPSQLMILGWDSIVNNPDRTFGAAAERARRVAQGEEPGWFQRFKQRISDLVA